MLTLEIILDRLKTRQAEIQQAAMQGMLPETQLRQMIGRHQGIEESISLLLAAQEEDEEREKKL